MWAGTRASSSWWNGDRAGVDQLADPGGEVLADAGQLAESARARGRRPRSARAATVSAALRYARILNGFSPLISRRSAISPSTRAIARLSMWRGQSSAPARESFASRSGSRAAARRRRRAPRRTAVACGPARRSRTGSRRRPRRRPCRRARPPRAPLRCRSSISGVVTPGASRFRFSHSAAIWRPTSSQSLALERLAHRDGDVADPLEARLNAARSPSMWRLVISQLLMPELRDAPV